MDCHLMEIRHPAGGYGVCLSHTVVRGSHVDVRDAGIRVSHEGFDGGCRVVKPSCSAPVKSHLLLLHSPQITFTVL